MQIHVKMTDWWMSYWFRLNTESHLFDYNLLFTPSMSSHNAHIVAVTSIWDYAILALNLLQVTLFQLGRQKTKFDKLYFTHKLIRQTCCQTAADSNFTPSRVGPT